MKCTECGKNIAVYHYVSNVNGDVTESHLCEDCARKIKEKSGEYPWDSFEKRMNESFGSFFLDDPFMSRMLPSFTGRRSRSLLDSFFDDDFFAMPSLGSMLMPGFFIPAARPQEDEKKAAEHEQEVSAEKTAEERSEEKKQNKVQAKLRNVDEAIDKKRRMAMLREKMHKAARQEDYETAAKLRDELRAMEERLQE